MVVVPAQKLRILSWNILNGEQIPPTKKLTAEQWKNNLITAATDVSQNLKPDFIGLQEVDLNQNRSGNLNQTKVIAESLELKYWAYIPTLIGTPGEKWKKVEVKQSPIITNDSPNQIINSLPPSYGIAFATNELGDIFLVGRSPLNAVTDREIDRLVGAVLQYSDSSFNPLLELGFANAIRREWAWRVSRGESLANLDAFKHLI